MGNDADLREVLLGEQGACLSLPPGGVVVDHTTTSAALARELDTQLQAQGHGFLDAPVSGGNLGALNGALTVMCGGGTDSFAQVEPILKAYAKAVTHLGAAGHGQLANMVNQVCVAGLLQGLAEALAFGPVSYTHLTLPTSDLV